jgi:YD repeat-containing protein
MIAGFAQDQGMTRSPMLASLAEANGNLVTQGLAAHYSYDAQNRLLGATKGASTMSVSYDGRNRPVSRTLNGTTTYFVYDGWRLIAEYSSTGTLLTRYVHGPVMDEILAKTDANGTVYYHHDELGSTVALSNAEGSVVESYSYDVFGNVTIFDSSFIIHPYKTTVSSSRAASGWPKSASTITATAFTPPS